MDGFLYETHMHTSEASACAVNTGAEMARAYKAAGYTGIIITDHFFYGNTAVDRKLPWRQWVERFCLGYEHAREEGERSFLAGNQDTRGQSFWCTVRIRTGFWSIPRSGMPRWKSR